MNDKEKQLMDAIANICEELGWSIAIPYTSDGEDQVQGLLIGTADYIESILTQLDEYDAVDFESEDELENIVLKKDDKETIH